VWYLALNSITIVKQHGRSFHFTYKTIKKIKAYEAKESYHMKKESKESREPNYAELRLRNIENGIKIDPKKFFEYGNHKRKVSGSSCPSSIGWCITKFMAATLDNQAFSERSMAIEEPHKVSAPSDLNSGSGLGSKFSTNFEFCPIQTVLNDQSVHFSLAAM
jgi:hypothetical protein